MRFEDLFELVRYDDFTATFNQEDEVALLREDLLTIVDTFVYYLNKAFLENKTFTIVGI